MNKELDEILPTDLPYPDYNMGLLPDEKGYDSDKHYRNTNAEVYSSETKQALLAWRDREVVKGRTEEWEQLAWSSEVSDEVKDLLQPYYSDRLKALNKELERKLHEQ